MSKGVIGGVIGATIGFFAGGNVVAGWNIGYGIGSTYDVTKLPGLGDASAVEAGEGGPRFRVYGAFRPIGGQTIAVGPEVEARVRERSKGGSPVESSRALRTYAIGFGEGPALFSRIWADTVLVYDARPNPDIPWAESLRWAENAAFYTGDFEQMPDPSLQEALGSDEVHGHRGTVYFVKKLEDYTDRGRRIPSYQAELFRGRARMLTSMPYPVIQVEGLGISSADAGGQMYLNAPENVSIGSVAMGGDLKDLVQTYEGYDPEDLDVSSTALGGELNDIIRVYDNYDPEEIDISSVALGGDLDVTLLIYENYDPEELEISSVALGGDLT